MVPWRYIHMVALLLFFSLGFIVRFELACLYPLVAARDGFNREDAILIVLHGWRRNKCTYDERYLS